VSFLLVNVHPEKPLGAFGLTGVTYFPRSSKGHIHEETAVFLSRVGLPSNDTFSPKLDLDDAARLTCTPGLRVEIEAQGGSCPPEAQGWEVLGVFQYALVALDPGDGKVYAFPEGEELYVPLHADVSSLVQSLIILEEGKAECKGFPNDDVGYQARIEAVEQLKRRIAVYDETPLNDESPWNALFDEISMGMWG
jgi:hypothetical protein